MTRLQIQENFSSQLRQQLQQRFRGRLPSAATFAAHFNCRVSDTTSGISAETARRWLRGECIPDKWRMRILAQWLEIDLQEALFLPGFHHEQPEAHVDEATKEMVSLFSQLTERHKSVFLNLLRVSASDEVLLTES
ncbi:MAG: hypothetical protein FGM18_02080 [Burkholderiaceae bacterium]|nr:hypothetical protein [Burkholderiaceae bacterium]